MGRGILSGLVWGSVVGFGIVTVANQVVDHVELTPISVPQPPVSETPVDTQIDDAQPQDTAPQDIAAEETATLDTGPSPEADAAQSQAPDAVDSVAQIQDADVLDEGISGSDVAAEAPVFGSLQSAELDQPDANPSFFKPVDTALPGKKPVPVGTSNLEASIEKAANAEPEVTSTPEQTAALEEEGTAEAIDAPVPDLGEGEVQSAEDVLETAEDIPEDVAKPTVSSGVQTSVGSFTDREDSLRSTRLPSLGAAKPETSSALNASSVDAQVLDAPIVDAADLPALIAYAADFEKRGSAPNMSVILLDTQEIAPDAALLANLPFPVTFAIDALAPDAAERSGMFLAAGHEVLAMVSVPAGATAQDAAVTMEQARTLVPTAVGFLDVPSSSFQTNRNIAAQVVSSAQSSGHGLVTFSSGLNAMMQEAERSDVPAALIFRDFDGQGQDTAAMKRFLDQAAFRAGIDEDIVMLGRAVPQTLLGLAEWALGNRAATVEMVPVSLLLQE